MRIVVADDHRMFREALRRLLGEQPGFAIVGEAADGDQVLELTLRLRPDILLLDFAMPGRSALQTLEALQASGAPTRVILLTAAMDRSDIITALRLGAYGVVLKESGSDLLLRAIRAVMAGQYWVGRDSVSDLVRTLNEMARSPAQTSHHDFGLTSRELEIVAAVVAACGNREIAQKFSISEKTVKHHLTNIFNKVGVSSRVELALFAIHHNLSLPDLPV